MLKVGDKVYLREDSEWNNGTKFNPVNVVGVIVRDTLDNDLNYVVEWSNGETNYYSVQDLILASEFATNTSMVTITEEEYHSLIEEINMLQELISELSKEKEPEEFKPISDYTMDDWKQAMVEGWVFRQRNGNLTTIKSINDDDQCTDYPVETTIIWVMLNGKDDTDHTCDLDIVERIK